MRTLTPLAAAVLIAAGAPGAASASASGKDTTPVPAASPPVVVCDYSLDGPTEAGSILSNQAGEAGCMSVIVSGDSMRLYDVRPSPGWAYKVTYDGVGKASSVRVDFLNGKKKASVLMEFGRTVIK